MRRARMRMERLDARTDRGNEAESMPVQGQTSGLGALDRCPVCSLNFHSREPKLLPCLHSFCRRCLPPPSRNLAMAAPYMLRESVADLGRRVCLCLVPVNVIRCPVCRQECMEVDVMENILVRDSVEAPSSTVERTVQLCMTCDDNAEAAAFCVNCAEYLCVTCVEAHQRVKLTRNHAIRQKEDVCQGMPIASETSTQRPVFCDIHKQEPLKLFCETCDLLTCRDCQLVKHKDHKYSHDLLSGPLQLYKSSCTQIQILFLDQNRSSVQSEIKKSICSLTVEINKKGKMLMNHLEVWQHV
uniref:Tripartite motif containing 45 n=1 Tax=Mola mola TaxID=94237 RepID=A0A3Q3VLL9_MOLML